ncbi:PREDICTED: poly(U)-specific endoribonuclease homolog [Cyphomyrmex costatus]|uniref:poly(U)-specific endoribonuclease homolog n=1 Tax=Cyphomyrmex costatus TaxID=456900 RepID=UPI00085224F2|nr:PREDICTED: poly(U)-specific endoribonuclease homolog [Cyphomyrmex costatus]
MKVRILLVIFLLTFISTNHVNARRSGSSRSSSRGSSSRSSYSSSSRSRSSSSSGHGSSSGGHTSGSSPSGHGSSSDRHTIGSGSTGYGSSSGHMTGSSSFGHGSSSGGHTSGSNPFGSVPRGGTGSNPTGTSSSQTSHQRNKDASSTFLQAEGGGATRPSQTNSAQSGRPLAPHGNTGTYLGSHGTSSFTNRRQNSASYNSSAPHNPSIPYKPSVPYNPSAPYNPYNPSAPSTNHLSKSTVVPSQNHAPTSFGQPRAPYNNPLQGTASSNPPWSNPHFNPSQSHPAGSTSANIGFKDHLRPTSMPVPSASYPRPPYPTSGINPHPPPYPSHSFNYPNQLHAPHVPSMHNPSYSIPSQSFGHPSSYPAHIPPPVPGTFGNPYSTHPVSGTYGAAGHTYYPQQHVLAQPAAQPYIPGQTVVMVPGQQDSGRGFGQMVKEALVFSTINAGVNRLINPHHHYVHDSSSPSSGTGTSETHITYNNHYFNTAPPGSVPPTSQNIPQGNVPIMNPINPNPVNNPVVTPGVSIPAIISNGSTTYPVGGSFVNTVGTVNNVETPSVVPPNEFSTSNIVTNQEMSNQGTTIYSPQYKISDDDLLMFTEELFVKQEVNMSKHLTLHLQSKSVNVTDAAKGPLIYVQEEAYDYPTILAIRALYDNYEHNSTMKETRTAEKRKKEEFLLDMFVNTNVMTKTLRWLSDRGVINPYDFEKDTLRRIWFNTFDGSTSGFERVFTSERYGTELLGVQDWIYFNYQESNNRIDYMGYVDIMKLGDRASLVKLNFEMDGIIRPNATIFVGTLPELEMALYTICFYTRPNNLCPVSLGGSKFNIFTHSFRYYGIDVIDLALPIF